MNVSAWSATASSRWVLAAWLLIGLFVSFALVVDHVASTVFAVFFLAGLWLLLRGRVTLPDLATRWVLIAFLAYFLVGVISFFLGEQTRLGEKILGRDIRFLGAAVVYFVFVVSVLPHSLLRKMLAVGGIVTGVFAIGEVLLVDQEGYRAGGRTVSIVFGHLAAGLFAINLGIAVFERRGRGLGIAGATFAIIAVILSGTRGALLSVAVVVLLASIIYFLRHGARMRKRSVVLSVSIGLVMIAAATSWMMPRMELASRQYDAYLQAMETGPISDEARGCLSDRRVLKTLAGQGRRFGDVTVSVIERDAPLADECSGSAVIRLVNDSDGAAGWMSPYRSLPVAAPGRLHAEGRARLVLESGDEQVEIRGRQSVAIPPVAAVDATRFHIRLGPGRQVDIVPVEVLPGEYAFAGMESSIGNRIDMWTGTWRQTDFSLLGQGTGSWPLAMVREAESGRMSWRLSGYDHAHSDYLNALLERGWLGLATLLGLFVAPLAWSRRQPRDWRQAALMLFVASFAVSAITETVFNHSIAITYYAVLVLLLMTARADNGSTLTSESRDH